jgi:hypothetical protein
VARADVRAVLVGEQAAGLGSAGYRA